jgi:hypothetical protein
MDRKKMAIPYSYLDEINELLLDPNNPLINALLEMLDEHGGVDEINRRAKKSGSLDNLMALTEQACPEYARDLEWLEDKRDQGGFISIPEYREMILGEKVSSFEFDDSYGVTLEIAGALYFPWIIEEAKRAIERRELMPSRYIRLRNMKEQEADGNLSAFATAMNIVGGTWVETLDTRGTDGSNIHLGGPETITGYFGGIGEPNDYPLKWADELIYYYTNYGIKEVLNTNMGTILIGYLMHKLGVDISFKISVFMGNDNPYSVLWTLLGAKLFSRQDGTTSLIGLNFANSINNDTIRDSDMVRRKLDFETDVRFEHHILETWKSIVVQPYDKRADLVEIASEIRNISAKHEGAEIEVEMGNDHPSDIFDYLISKKETEERGLMPAFLKNYLQKHEAVNNTARALTENGETFIAAKNLHY